MVHRQQSMQAESSLPAVFAALHTRHIIGLKKKDKTNIMILMTFLQQGLIFVQEKEAT